MIEILNSHEEHSSTFQIRYQGKEYRAKVYLNESEKFIDWEILDANGDNPDDDTENIIIDYLSVNWNKILP